MSEHLNNAAHSRTDVMQQRQCQAMHDIETGIADRRQGVANLSVHPHVR